MPHRVAVETWCKVNTPDLNDHIGAALCGKSPVMAYCGAERTLTRGINSSSAFMQDSKH